jgi:hypothetical protein
MQEQLTDHRTEIYRYWEPVKQYLLTGDLPDFTLFKGLPGERKMNLLDIVPIDKKLRGRPRFRDHHKTMVDWIRTKIKAVIIIGSNWVDNNIDTNSRLIFDPRLAGPTGKLMPINKEVYQDALHKFRQRLVGFGDKPEETIWHILNLQNAKQVTPSIQKSIDEVIDLVKEIIHFNRLQTPEDKYPNPGEQPPGSPTDH